MVMRPPRKSYQTRIEYLTCEYVNAGAPQHVVDSWAMQIMENRRTWSALWDDAVHGMLLILADGTPIS